MTELKKIEKTFGDLELGDYFEARGRTFVKMPESQLMGKKLNALGHANGSQLITGFEDDETVIIWHD